MTATSTLRTLGSPFSMLMFSLTKEDAVTINASAHVAADCHHGSPPLALSTYAALFAVTLPWSFLSSKVEISVNGSDWGCFADRFSWCDNLTAVSPWVYYSSSVLVLGLARSIVDISMTTLFSEIIGPRRQGTLQGVYQMAGSSGNILGPLLSSMLYMELGPKATWTTEIVQILIVVGMWIIFRRKLVGLQTSNLFKEKTSTKDSI